MVELTGDYTQDGRFFKVETPLGKDVLLLEGFSGQEGISRPFRYTLDLLSKEKAIAPESLLEKPVSVRMELPTGDSRAIHGVVASFTQLERSDGLTAYQAEIVPPLWFLSLTRDCRIFQGKTVLEIISAVLEEQKGLEYDLQCMDSYDSRDFCVQYRESDLAFISRLMEEEGIYYFFEHDHNGDQHRLILADDPGAFSDGLQDEIYHTSLIQGALEFGVVTEIAREHSVHPTTVTLSAYDHLQPSLPLLSTVTLKGGSSSGAPDHEVYDYPGKYEDTGVGERSAKVQLDALSSQGDILRGSSTARAFQSGDKVSIKGGFGDSTSVECVLVSVEHTASGGGYRSGTSRAQYENRFVCIPQDTPFQPVRVTPKPIVQGSQTAVVVGPKGEEIFTDEHGRVKVQFHWDREGRKDENSSCWIRVSHPWAGKNWGAVMLPRIGQEVIVDFLEGDPDLPIITGRVYNATQIPPYDLPAQKTQSGIKSRSSSGGGSETFNEIRMEDKKGEELLYFHAELNRRVVVEQNNFERVGNDEEISIGGNQELTVEKDRTVAVSKDHTETVAADQSISVGSDRDMAVGGDLSDQIGGKRTTAVGGDETTAIGGKLALEVGKDANVSVSKKATLKVTGDASMSGMKTVEISALNEIKISSGAASITLKKDGNIEIKGVNVKVAGAGKVEVKAGAKLTLKGATIAAN